MNCYKYIFIIILLSKVAHSSAQDVIIGVNYAYGKASYQRQSDDLTIAARSTQQAGLIVEYSPYFSRLNLISGINYESNDLCTYLTLPLDFRISLGNNLQPFFELGGYYAHPISSKQSRYTVTRDLGVRIGAGLMYRIDKRWRIELAYFHIFGFRGLLEEEVQLPLGQSTREKYDQRSGSLRIGLKYRF